MSLAFLVLIAALALAGCGGGEDEQSSSETKAQYLMQAQAICRHAKTEKEQAISQALSGGEPSAHDLEDVVEKRVIPAYHKALARLIPLEAPAGEERVVDAIWAGYESALKDTEAQPRLLIEGDPFSQAEKAARNYGLEACVF